MIYIEFEVKSVHWVFYDINILPFTQKRKMVGESTSTQVLRDLEISLRTNHIE